jgi:hypothetical protein
VAERRRVLRERIAQHPRAVRFEDLRRLLEAYGWELARIRGSHHIFVRGNEALPIPYRRPHVLPAYVRRALRLTEGYDAAGDEEQATDGSGSDP